jgi:uncharacterized repeat protein (TIGR03803 family)
MNQPGLRNLQVAIFCLVFCVVTSIGLHAQTFTTLAEFDQTNGAGPSSSLIQATDGNFYGITTGGGTYYSGTIFKITPAGVLTTLHNFQGADGATPLGALVQASNGNFYGTTSFGGSTPLCPSGCGSVFKMTAKGKLTTLHSFCSQGACADGNSPQAGMVQGTDGSFYGTTIVGGTSGYGTVFKISAAGKLKTLHSFDGTDGRQPASRLVQGMDGNFYGTAQYGGTYDAGSIFKISPKGKLKSLYSFCGQAGCPDGDLPLGELTQGLGGSFYGTTYIGGTNSSDCGGGCGTVYKITSAGALTTIYNFCAEAKCADGYLPQAGLTLGTDGNLYGTNIGGGATGNGTIFQITPAGTLTTLHSFDSISYSQGVLIQSTSGPFYGTTVLGGVFGNCTDGCGTVFGLDTGLGPFVEAVPGAAKAGANVLILGNNLTGTTAVSFNGMAATFTVVSSTEIKTKVPAGATTGTVTVTTPSGALKSNVAFRVIR